MRVNNHLFEEYKFYQLGPPPVFFVFSASIGRIFSTSVTETQPPEAQRGLVHITVVRSETGLSSAIKHPVFDPSNLWSPTPTDVLSCLFPSLNSMASHHNHSLAYSFNSLVPLTLQGTCGKRVTPVVWCPVFSILANAVNIAREKYTFLLTAHFQPSSDPEFCSVIRLYFPAPFTLPYF